MREPRRETGRRTLRSALFTELHGVVAGAEAQPRADVATYAQPVVTRQCFVPARRLVAVEVTQEVIVRGRGEHRFDFAREHDGGRGRPRRKQSGMDEQPFAFAHHQRPRAQPSEQLVAIGRIEDRPERIVPVGSAMAGSDGQQMQIVVPQHRDRGVAEFFHGSQHRQRIGAAVDEVANQPQAIAGWIEGDQLEQLPELGMAALNIADDIVAHWESRRSRTVGEVAAKPASPSPAPPISSV